MNSFSIPKKELLFLDFDGVLGFGTDAQGRYSNSITLLQNLLLANSSLYVVFTTTWRNQYDIDQLATLFPENVRSRFIGKTPNSMSQVATREYEVMAYLRNYEEEHNYAPHWVAFDDRSDLFSPKMKNLVLVRHLDSSVMKTEDVALAQKILNEQRKPVPGVGSAFVFKNN